VKEERASRIAYVDTSCLVAIALGERDAATLERRLSTFGELVASNLLEAELRATFAREGVAMDPDFLTDISWVLPARSLSGEIERALSAGYLGGADCWHVAVALYLADDPAQIAFLTLDNKQREVAQILGFET
jgi:PIN domain-containing protein